MVVVATVFSAFLLIEHPWEARRFWYPLGRNKWLSEVAKAILSLQCVCLDNRTEENFKQESESMVWKFKWDVTLSQSIQQVDTTRGREDRTGTYPTY